MRKRSPKDGQRTKKTLQRNLLKMIFLGLIVFLLLQSPTKQGDITLLTISGEGQNLTGGTANINLQIRTGTGRVFIDTFPFSKLDTQISTRFAKEIACSYTKKDCSNYDFFYTIRADSNIVGGPSAGGAISALTAALLESKSVRKDIAMTGTINSGGIIGAVGGVKEKVLAAQEAGMKIVIIPRWQFDEQAIRDQTLRENLTAQTNLTDNNTDVTKDTDNRDDHDKQFENLSIKVIKVDTLNEAMHTLTGEELMEPNKEVKVKPEYESLMRRVAKQLCNRSELIKQQLPKELTINNSLYNYSEQFLRDAKDAEKGGKYYSQASYCFSANLKLRTLQLENFSQEKLEGLRKKVARAIKEKKEEVQAREDNTLTQLQTTGIVTTRLEEAASYLKADGNISSPEVAYAIERYNSAIVWSNFYSLKGRKTRLDEEHLKKACEAKLGEAQERKSYLKLMLGEYYPVKSQQLEDARRAHHDKRFALCIFTASQAKAEVDAIISGFTVPEEEYEVYIEEKLLVAKNIMIKEARENRFPLMGYSYYEYAKSLKEYDPYLASLFASYSLELSDLSNYFPPEDRFWERLKAYLSNEFTRGFIIGVLVILIMGLDVQKKRTLRKA